MKFEKTWIFIQSSALVLLSTLVFISCGLQGPKQSGGGSGGSANANNSIKALAEGFIILHIGEAGMGNVDIQATTNHRLSRVIASDSQAKKTATTTSSFKLIGGAYAKY